MTNLEALKANLSSAHGAILDENHFEKALSDVGLVSASTYTNSVLVDKATLLLYQIIISGANLSEGALSYSINIESVIKAKDILEKKLGLSTKGAINVARPW